jgi:hypothetical protein
MFGIQFFGKNILIVNFASNYFRETEHRKPNIEHRKKRPLTNLFNHLLNENSNNLFH